MSRLLDDSSLSSPTNERMALIREGTDMSSVAKAASSSKLRCAVGTMILVSALAIATAIHASVFRGLLRNDGLRKETGKEAAGFVEEGDDDAEEVKKDMCPGCDDPNYRCVVAMDGSFSQCIDCSPAGNWNNDCPVWPELLRKAAVETCGLACGDMMPPKDSHPAIEPYCHMGSMEPAYSHERCEKMKDHSLRVSCESPDPNKCGVELNSHWGTGGGMYTVSMQAARGAGLSTRFYLYTYGLGKDRSKAWNEISLEVLGKTCSSSETTIVTDFTAGPFDSGADYWAREKSHQELIKVPFDACQDWHTYTLDIENGSISWMADDLVYRQDDISEYDDLVVALYQRELQARLALVGQDENAGGWEEMGYLSQNEFPFPTYAWFANIDIPTYDDVDGDEAEPNSGDPSALEDADGTADDDAVATSEGSGGHRSKAAALKHKQTSRSEGAGNASTDDSDNRSSEAATSRHGKASRPDDAGDAAADDDDDDGDDGDDEDEDDDDEDEGGARKRDDSDHDRSGNKRDDDGDDDDEDDDDDDDSGGSGGGGGGGDDDLKQEDSDHDRSGATASRTSRSDDADGTAADDTGKAAADSEDEASGSRGASPKAEDAGGENTDDSDAAAEASDNHRSKTDGSDHQSSGVSTPRRDEHSRREHLSTPSAGATSSGSEDSDNDREKPDDSGSVASPADTDSDDDSVDIDNIADSIRDIAAQIESGDVHNFGENTQGPPEGG